MGPQRNAGSAALALAHLVLIGIGAGSFGFCAYSVLNHKSHLAVRIAPALIGMAAPLLLAVRPAIRVTVASICIGVGVGLYAAQLFALALTDPERPALQAIQKEAREAHVPYDGRTRVEVIMDLRRRGVQAEPPFYPYLLLDSPLQVDGEPTIALGNMARTTSVCCNEGGQYLIYQTDEHGFPNPPNSWSADRVDLAIVGGSGAVSESVQQADGLPALMRDQYPRTVTLGAGGNGPLLELASIREYLPALKPKQVLWLFSESHSPDYLVSEARSQALLRYLDASYRQHLIDKQEGIDRAIAQYFESGLRGEQMSESWTNQARNFAFLKSVRTLLYYFVTARTAHPEPVPFDAALFEKILEEGRSEISAWGGKVTVVYWPDSSRYAGICNYSPALRQIYDRTRDAFLNAATQAQLPVIDLSKIFPDVPASESTKDAEYFYPYPAHMKPAGYHHVANAILSNLAAASNP